MSTFLFLYRGAAPYGLSAEQAEQRSAAFGAWIEKLGPALIEVGSPFGDASTVRADGTTGPAGGMSGFSVVRADDLATAEALTAGLPFLADGDPNHAVEIYGLSGFQGEAPSPRP